MHVCQSHSHITSAGALLKHIIKRAAFVNLLIMISLLAQSLPDAMNIDFMLAFLIDLLVFSGLMDRFACLSPPIPGNRLNRP